MIILNNIQKEYGSQLVLDNISFTLSRGEKVALVGRNGGGKTTLLKIITSREDKDGGEVIISKNYDIGVLSQNPSFKGASVLEEVFHLLNDGSDAEEWQIKKVLSGLGFSDDDMDRNISIFSGGYQMRVALAAALVAAPDCLILDEPTNFLDIHSIRWLEGFLKDWKNELLVVSHDRSFLDSFVTHVAGIYRSKLRKIGGNTVDYYSQILLEDDIYEKKRLNEEKKRKQTEEFIQKFRAKARQASLAQSRIKTLEKKEVMEELKSQEKLDFSFPLSLAVPRYSFEARKLGFGYNKDKLLFQKLDFTVFKDDKICVIGKNGKGKSTLLKLMAGLLTGFQGVIRQHPKTDISYFAQANTVNLDSNRSIEQEIFISLGSEDRKKARSICGAMMFSQDLALKKISVLSGGEKCRVLLGKMLATPANTLLLDEPTHHLDMESTEALGDALSQFPGAVILVTHNEHLIRKVAKKLIIFDADKAYCFEGSYNDFIKSSGWQETERDLKAPVVKKNVSKKEDRRIRAERTALRSKMITPLKNKIKSLEKDIEAQEKSLQQTDEEIVRCSEDGDWQKLKDLGVKKKDIESFLEKIYEQLIEKNEELEEALENLNNE